MWSSVFLFLWVEFLIWYLRLTSSTQAILSRLELEGNGYRQHGRAGAPSTLVSSLAPPCHPHSYPQLSSSFVFFHCIPFQVGHLSNQAQFVSPLYYFFYLPPPQFSPALIFIYLHLSLVFTFHNPRPHISIETQLYSWLFLWAAVGTSRSEWGMASSVLMICVRRY